MRRPGDYEGEMFNVTVSDREIESLLTGSPAQNGDLSDLAGFVETLRAYERLTPSEDAVERFANAAAAQVRAAQAPTAAPTASRDRLARRPLGLRPQVAAMLTTVLLVAGSTGVALAADAAAPGDGLYWLDRTVENIGIGDGSAGERLEEARVLVAEGQAEFALTHVFEALDEADDDVAQARTAVTAAIEDLETAGPEAGDTAIDEINVLLDYLSENIGQGVGADGGEFGQGVAELARGITSDDETEVTEPADEPAPSSGDQPEDDAGTDEGPGRGNGNGSSVAPGNGNPDPPGNPGNGNGNGNTNPDPAGTAVPLESSDPDPPGNGIGNGNTTPPAGGNPGPPRNNGSGNGNNGNGNGSSQGTGPPPESPSATAPGQSKKP